MHGYLATSGVKVFRLLTLSLQPALHSNRNNNSYHCLLLIKESKKLPTSLPTMKVRQKNWAEGFICICRRFYIEALCSIFLPYLHCGKGGWLFLGFCFLGGDTYSCFIFHYPLISLYYLLIKKRLAQVKKCSNQNEGLIGQHLYSIRPALVSILGLNNSWSFA